MSLIPDRCRSDVLLVHFTHDWYIYCYSQTGNAAHSSRSGTKDNDEQVEKRPWMNEQVSNKLSWIWWDYLNVVQLQLSTTVAM